MARYIDADKLKERIGFYCDHTTESCGEHYAYNKAFCEIERMPTADVAEVVRCKDCKHYWDGRCSKISYIMDGYYQGGFEVKKPDDYCSYGERKE